MNKYKLMLGDNMESLKKVPDNSIDSVVTDPPYALVSIKKRFGKEGSAEAKFGNDGAFQRASKGFMGKEWDAEVPTVEFWREVYRVLKPGGHVLSFGGTRTYHRMVVNCEDAGFEVRDCISWLYGSGFPKSLNISKNIDKKYGRIGSDLVKIKTRLKELYTASGKTMKKIDEECGFKASGYLRTEHRDDDGWGEALPTEDKWEIISKVILLNKDTKEVFKKYFLEAERDIVGKGKAGFLEKNDVFELHNDGYGDYNITKSNTNEGKKYEGWGTALKPAQELILLARKPLSEKTIVDNVIKWGTGGINIDGCRVGNEKVKINNITGRIYINEIHNENKLNNTRKINGIKESEGRFPANLILECICDEVIKGESGEIIDSGGGRDNLDLTHEWGYKTIVRTNYTDTGDIHTNPDCPCYILDKQSIKNAPSRYFYVAKVSKKERNLGLDEFEEKKTGTIRQKNNKCIKCGFWQNLGAGNGVDFCKCDEPEWEDRTYIHTVKNAHPTVKPINLLIYLCRLITPENGIVLDPFMGSGSTGIAALLEGFRFCGMEMDEDYFKIAKSRIENYEEYRKLIK